MYNSLNEVMECALKKTMISIVIILLGMAGCGTSTTIKHIPYGVEPTSLRFECKGKCPNFHTALAKDPTLAAKMFDHLIALPEPVVTSLGGPLVPPSRPEPDYYLITFLRDDAVGIQISVRLGLANTGSVIWQYNGKAVDTTFLQLFDHLYMVTQGMPYPTPTLVIP